MKCRELRIEIDLIGAARTEALKRVRVQAARTAFRMLETSRNSEIPHRTAMPNCLMSKHKIQPAWFVWCPLYLEKCPRNGTTSRENSSIARPVPWYAFCESR